MNPDFYNFREEHYEIYIGEKHRKKFVIIFCIFVNGEKSEQ